MAGLVERILQDGADGAGAAAAFRAAPEAGLNLGRRARAIRPPMQAGADCAIGQDVAGTDDHAGP